MSGYTFDDATTQVAKLDRGLFHTAVTEMAYQLTTCRFGSVNLEPGDCTRYRIMIGRPGEIKEFVVTPFNVWGEWGWWAGQDVDAEWCHRQFIAGTASDETGRYTAAVYSRFLTELAGVL